MEARVVNNLSPAAAHDGAVRCLLAIELSKRAGFWRVVSAEASWQSFPAWARSQYGRRAWTRMETPNLVRPRSNISREK